MEIVQVIVDLLKSLGVNSTIGPQMIIFAVTYLFLNHVLFKPYLTAHLERIARTTGSEESAQKDLQEAAEIGQVYEQRARNINKEFNEIYQKNRIEAQTEYDRLIARARADSASTLEKARLSVGEQLIAAEREIASNAAHLGTEMATNLIGKEI